MGWPKGKPRLSEEERAERALAAERPNYPYRLDFYHGDGKRHGCGEVVHRYVLGAPGAEEEAHRIMDEHKKVCWAKEDAKRGRKAEDVAGDRDDVAGHGHAKEQDARA